MSELPECHSRHDFSPDKRLYFCAHPKVHSAGNLVTATACSRCTRWQEPAPKHPRPYPTKLHLPRDRTCLYFGEQIDLRDCVTCSGSVRVKVFDCKHADHEETTVRQCEKCFDYERTLKQGDVSSWAVGVTTAPRAEPTLERSLQSIRRAGWEDVRVFAEPGVEVPATLVGVRVTQRESTLGAWPNWYLGLAELYMRSPDADAFLMIQDDALVCRNVRELLEAVLWPSSPVGVVSFYCPESYATSQTGFRLIDDPNGLLGAVTYVLPNFAARRLLSDTGVVEHRLRGEPVGLRGIDAVLGAWLRKHQLPAYYHSPSLVDHLGETTTIWPGEGERSDRRRAGRFVGEAYDARKFIASVRE